MKAGICVIQTVRSMFLCFVLMLIFLSIGGIRRLTDVSWLVSSNMVSGSFRSRELCLKGQLIWMYSKGLFALSYIVLNYCIHGMSRTVLQAFNMHDHIVLY